MSQQPPIKPELEPQLKQEPEFTPQQLVKMLLELGPLVIFFLVNSQRGIFWGTGCFMVATAIALAASWRILGRIPVMPLVSGALGAGLGWGMGLSVGGTALLATLMASASYIAVPAAMRLSVPEANPALSLAASLGITFPFNIVVGIPLYHRFAEYLHRLGG